jgi:hypothetical protein
MPTREESGIIFDLPDVDVDTLAAFIHDRVMQRPAVHVPPDQIVPDPILSSGVSPAPPRPSGPVIASPTTPLARSLSSIGRYLEVLRNDVGAIHEWLRIDAERDARQEYQLTATLDRLAGSLDSLADEMAAVNTRLDRLETNEPEARPSPQPREDPEMRLPGDVARLWSRIRGGRS